MIKKIYAFGTSHTAGGGFEFDKPNGVNPNMYNRIYNSRNHYDFSYPNILGRFLGIETINHAKQGFGYQRVNRKILETISNPSFNKDESLLLIECSNIDRHEFYYKPFEDYISMIVNPNNIQGPKNFPVAKDWNYQTKQEEEHLNIDSPRIFDFFKDITDFDDVLKKNQINLLFMINFLENSNFNYYLTNGDGDLPLSTEHRNYFNEDKFIKYKLYDFSKNKYEDVFCWTGVCESFKLNIIDETNGIIQDKHQGMATNQHIACTIYNRMIDDGYIDSEYKYSDLKEKFIDIKNIVSTEHD